MRTGRLVAIGVLVLAVGGAALASSESIPAFRDVPRDHWAAEAVQALAEWGIVTGYPDPDAPIPAFSDVPRSHWAAEAVQALAEWGIVKGYPSAGRQEVPDWAAEGVKALRDLGISFGPAPLYADVPATHWAFEAVTSLTRMGIIRCYP